LPHLIELSSLQVTSEQLIQKFTSIQSIEETIVYIRLLSYLKFIIDESHLKKIHNFYDSKINIFYEEIKDLLKFNKKDKLVMRELY
jgi:hypothetical protein